MFIVPIFAAKSIPSIAEISFLFRVIWHRCCRQGFMRTVRYRTLVEIKHKDSLVVRRQYTPFIENKELNCKYRGSNESE